MSEGLFIICAFLLVLVAFFYALLWWDEKQFERDMSNSPDVYGPPTGEPKWDNKLPEQVDDYTEPRIVYEDLVESTSPQPGNKRVVGYRISPTLVIHSRVKKCVNRKNLQAYIDRYQGQLLTEDDLIVFRENMDKVSELRKKVGDTPLILTDCWTLHDDEPAIADFCLGAYWAPNNSFGYPLVLKR